MVSTLQHRRPPPNATQSHGHLLWWNVNFSNFLAANRRQALADEVEGLLRERPFALSLQEVLQPAVKQLSAMAASYDYKSHYVPIGRTHDGSGVHGLFMAVHKRVDGEFRAIVDGAGFSRPIQAFYASGVGIGNTHFPIASVQLRERAQTAEAVKKWLRDDCEIRVLGGDFNAGTGWPVMRDLRSFLMALSDASADRSWQGSIGPFKLKKTIDHVLCNFDVRDSSVHIRNVNTVSDHQPLELRSDYLGSLAYQRHAIPVIDEYTEARGGHSTFLQLSCRSCGCTVGYYQKDGPGPLLRCYFDRLHVVSRRAEPRQKWQASPDCRLNCPGCDAPLGEGMIYGPESRPAFRVFSDAFAGITDRQ